MKRFLVVMALLSLTGCESFQAQCIRLASHDVIVLDRLIAESQANLARGYALVDTVVTLSVFRPCYRRPEMGGFGPDMCEDEVDQTVSKPVAIDLKAEAAKLASMQAKRAQIARQLAPALAECQARYPDQ